MIDWLEWTGTVYVKNEKLSLCLINLIHYFYGFT